MKRATRTILAIAALVALLPAAAQARTILFIGNSFTFGASSPAHYYNADTVTDLNGPGANGKSVGGVPAIFKAFTKQAGLDYDVSVETVGGKGIDYHYTQKRELIDKPWDAVVLQSYSTMDKDHPGNPALLISSATEMTAMLRAANPKVAVWLDATWSRADQTYPETGAWHGKPIQQMGKDIYAGYLKAAASAHASGVIPLGLAWNRAFDTGVADPNPYDGIDAGKLDLWTWDHYHASIHGYYLEALMVFGKVTGKDPLSLGENESVAQDMGFSKPQTRALQQLAHDQLAQ
jgi:hypothetical protein